MNHLQLKPKLEPRTFELLCSSKSLFFTLQCLHSVVFKLVRMNSAKISTHVSGTPGRHQCIQSCPHIATASCFPNQIAGWASALNSLKWVRSSSLISVVCNLFSIIRFILLASLFTPLFLGSNHKSSCLGLSNIIYQNAKTFNQ